MPSCGGYEYFWEEDPKRWLRCKNMAAKQMLAEGWSKCARKFSCVQTRRAKKLWLIY